MWVLGGEQHKGGPAGPTGWHLTLYFSVESSRVFWNLLVSVSPWISMILFDDLILLDGFSG